ncbi:SMP-30/gluconolactonase/LRE family protein [Longispora albida]|uniref:SMP-30/gluconolactonase/LRE family protein n=1 Tax=Longispora albida TaxID=203523 RepID=UPI0012FBCA32|nr:SMP-30/gluconolactonase/LRE family protein [Longispora albida]
MINEYALPGDAVFPEGITEDPDGVTFYVSSARQGTIFRCRSDRAEAEVWQPAGAEGRTRALGMAVDGHGRLLVCGWETGFLFAYDTATGELLARLHFGGKLNDVCVAGGYAYVTDSGHPTVWRIAAGERIGEPEAWLDLTAYGEDADANPFLNGIIPVAGGEYLLVAAQGTGNLWRISTTTAQAEPVDMSFTLYADGMVRAGDVVYACDNDDDNFYLTAFTLDADFRKAELAGRWARPFDETPTTAGLVGGRLLLVNSQFANASPGAPFTVSAIEPPL